MTMTTSELHDGVNEEDEDEDKDSNKDVDNDELAIGNTKEAA